MLSVRTLVNSRLSQKLVKDADAPYHGKTGKVGEVLHMTATKDSSPASFPTLNVYCPGEPSANSGLNPGVQNYILSTIELKSFTNTSLTDARKLADLSGDVMLGMNYELIYGPEPLSEVAPYCVVARFRRLVGAGEIKNM